MPNLPYKTAGQYLIIDDRIRGFPTGHAPVKCNEIGRFGWKPFDGNMALPLISMDESAFDTNMAAMLGYAKAHKVALAPHAKTPMSPELAKRLVDNGAWGATVADMRQASVLLQAGFRKLILGNEIGGVRAVKRLARLLVHYPDAELHIFVDSVAFAQALIDEWKEQADLPKLGLLVELGIARAGARTAEAAQTIVELIVANETSNLVLSGVAAYEGAAGVADPDETIARVDRLLVEAGEVYRFARRLIDEERPLMMSAGGSAFFDRVIKNWAHYAQEDAQLTIMLRSGAIFFHDHGVYKRGLAQLDSRNGFDDAQAALSFRPALRLWVEVLSRPEENTIICGFGMRDVAIDQDMPIALSLYRNGVKLCTLSGVVVQKLNDQHAFIQCAADADILIGDVIELGISHPCTCIDRYALIYGLDGSGTVIHAYPTYFG